MAAPSIIGLRGTEVASGRADSTTQQTLRAVHEALEILVARLGGPGASGTARPVAETPRGTQPADRLEAAVRASMLSPCPRSRTSRHAGAPASGEAGDATGTCAQPRSSISGSRTAASATSAPASSRRPAGPHRHIRRPQPEESQMPRTGARPKDGTTMPSEAQPLATRRSSNGIRKTFHSQRRPLLFSVALLAMAAGTAEILSRASADGAGDAACRRRCCRRCARDFGSARRVSLLGMMRRSCFPTHCAKRWRRKSPAALYEMASRLASRMTGPTRRAFSREPPRRAWRRRNSACGAIYEQG